MADDNRGLASADEETREEVAHKGGEARAQQLGHDGYQKLGQKGGQAAQSSGNAHQLTEKERSKGGSMSGGNFKNRPKDEVEEIARKGGQH